MIALAVFVLVGLGLGSSAAVADDCANIGGTFNPGSGECQVATTFTLPSGGGSFAIATPLRITSTGSIIIPSAPGVQSSFTLTVAGNFTADISATGGFAISGNGASAAPSIGAAISIQALGDIRLEGNGNVVGAQIRANSGVSTCASTNRAGSIALTSTRGHITLVGGSKLFTTGGCLGGEMTITAPVGNVVIGGRLLSQGVVTTTSTALPVRGGPITVSAAGNLTVGPGALVASQGSTIGPVVGTKFNYGADRVHLESGGDMTINGTVQSVGGFSFGPDILGGINRCTGASRVGKPSTPTSCVELWVGGDLTTNGGDPRDPTNLNNGYINARSGDLAQANGTCCSWIDIYVMGDVRLKGQPSGVSTNGFMIDSQQSSNGALGGSINLMSIKGKVTASGRTFIADAATAGGTGGTVKIQAAGPQEYPVLPPGQFHAADLRSNVDLGDSLQFARGANTGTTGGAGTIYIRSFNGQITGGAVDVLAPGTSVTLPVGTVLCAIGLLCDLQVPPLPTVLSASVTVTLPFTTFVAPATASTVVLGTGTRVTMPGGLVSVLWRDVEIATPAGKVANPSLTPLAGGCTNRLTGAPIINPATSSQYVCDEFLGTTNAGGIGSTQLVIELCEGWLYNGTTVPLTTTFSPQCGGKPEPPPDVVIPIAPTISIFGGTYLFDSLQRPATGDHTNGQFTMSGAVWVAVVRPTAFGENGATEPLLPLPSVSYVDANGVPVAVPIQVGTYTATALFPGCSPSTIPCGPVGTPQATKTYTGLVTSAPIIIFSNQNTPRVTVVGGVYRFDGQPHPATGVTTTDAANGSAITAPATTVYYNCTWTQSTPPATAAQLVAGPAAFGPGCTTTPPVNTTTTKVNLPAGNVAALADGMPVLAYFPGNSTYGPAIATAGIAIWQPRPSVTTATGGTFVYDGTAHPTTTTVRDGGTDGLGTTYPTSVATVNPATWTFTDPATNVTSPSGVTYTGATSPLQAVNVQAPVNVGSYPVVAVYPGDAIHSASTGTNTIVITPRPVTMTSVGGTFTCDNAVHGATGSIIWVNPQGQTVNLGSPVFTYRDSNGTVLAGPPTATGTYTVTSGLPPGLLGNHNAAETTAAITITARTATITLTGGTFVFDGQAHPVAATLTGTGIASGTQPIITYTKDGLPTGVPTAVGTYTATATLPPALQGCYTGSNSTTIVINPPPTPPEPPADEACIVIDLREITYFKNSTVITSSDSYVRSKNGLYGGFKPSLWPYSASGGYDKTTSRGTLFRIYGFKQAEVGVGIPDVDVAGRLYPVKEDTSVSGPGRFYIELNEPGGAVGGHPARVMICPSQLQTNLIDCNGTTTTSGGSKDDGEDGKDSGGKDGSGSDDGKDSGSKSGWGSDDGKDSGSKSGDAYTRTYSSWSGSDDGKDGKDDGSKSSDDGKDDGNDEKDGKDGDDGGKDESGSSSTCPADAGVFANSTPLTSSQKNVPGIMLTHNASALTVPQRVRTELSQLGMPLQNPPGTATTRAAVDYIAVQHWGGGSSTYREFVDVRVTFLDDSQTNRRQHYAAGLHTAKNIDFDDDDAFGCDYLDSDPTNDTIRLNDNWDGTHVGSPDWGPACGSREPSANQKKRETASVLYNTVQLLSSVNTAADTTRIFYGTLRPLPASTSGGGTSTTGAYTTYTQGGWGANPSGNNPGALLASKWSTVYGSGSVSIGGTKKLTFTSASAIAAFLPQGGTPSVLTSTATNPSSSSAGVFAGQVLALRLSVDFSDAGVTKTGLRYKKVGSGNLAGYTVTQVLSLANSVIGGTTSALPWGISISELNAVVDAINNNYDNGTTNKGYLQ